MAWYLSQRFPVVIHELIASFLATAEQIRISGKWEMFSDRNWMELDVQEAFEVFKFRILFDLPLYFDTKLCAYAAKNRNLEFLKTLRFLGCPWDESTTLAAAESGCLEVMKYLVLNNCPILVIECCEASIKNGDKEMMQFLIREFDLGTSFTLVERAGFYGRVDMVPELGFGQVADFNEHLISVLAEGAAKAGHQNFFEVHRSALAFAKPVYAIESGQFELAKWFMIQNPQSATQRIVSKAAYAGSVDLVVWLCDTFHFPIPVVTLHQCKNPLEMIPFLHPSANDEIWGKVILKCIERHDNHTAHILIERGKIPRFAFRYALENRNWEFITWMTTRDTIWSEQNCWKSAKANIFMSEDLPLLEKLHSLGVPILCSSGMCHAARQGNLEVVQWLVSHKLFYLPFDNCTASGNLELVKFAFSRNPHKAFLLWQSAASWAAQNGHLRILVWMDRLDPLILENPNPQTNTKPKIDWSNLNFPLHKHVLVTRWIQNKLNL